MPRHTTSLSPMSIPKPQILPNLRNFFAFPTGAKTLLCGMIQCDKDYGTEYVMLHDAMLCCRKRGELTIGVNVSVNGCLGVMTW